MSKAHSEEGEERRGPRAPACWVAIQRLQGVTDRRRNIIGLHESKLKSQFFPLPPLHKKQREKGASKSLVSKSPPEKSRGLVARRWFIDLTYSYRDGISNCTGANVLTQ